MKDIDIYYERIINLEKEFNQLKDDLKVIDNKIVALRNAIVEEKSKESLKKANKVTK